MKCPSCKFEAENGTKNRTWNRKKKDFEEHKEYFFYLRDKCILIDEANPPRYFDDGQVILLVCPKCGTVFVEDYKIHS